MPVPEPHAASVLVAGVTPCADCRVHDAEVTVDPGERWARHVCLDCADDELERVEARAIAPAFADVIRWANTDVKWRPLPVPPVDLATCDYTLLNARRAEWLAFSGQVREAARCWAVLRDGGRCVRLEAREGLCETHLAMGASVPGLGWAGGVPQGPIVARRGRSAA